MISLVLPVAMAPCDCENHAHDIRRVGDEVHHVCQSCMGTTKVVVLDRPVRHPTAATVPGIKGGQARGGAELERGAVNLLAMGILGGLLLALVVVRGCTA